MMFARHSFRITLLLGMIAAGLGTASDASSQATPQTSTDWPTSAYVLRGYGTVGTEIGKAGSGDFFGGFNPIFLWMLGPKILFEAELATEFEAGGSALDVEYVQIDYLAHDNLTVVAGKFLLPFGVFGERLHPTWINRFVTSPLTYGIGHSGAGAVVPVLTDFGVQARGAFRINPDALVNYALFVTQGPQLGGEEAPFGGGSTTGGGGGATGLGAASAGDGAIPGFGFSEDNNKKKAIGGRLGLMPASNVEVGVSFLQSEYDDAGRLSFDAWNVDAEVRFDGLEVRGEFVERSLETAETVAGEVQIESAITRGFYLLGTYRVKSWEPVLQYSEVRTPGHDGEESETLRRLGVGLDYWFAPSVALMAGYEINRESVDEIDNDRLIVHWAFGF